MDPRPCAFARSGVIGLAPVALPDAASVMTVATATSRIARTVGHARPAATVGWKNAVMSDYTKVNLREVEDSAPKFGLAPDVQARFPKRELGCEIGAVSLQRLAPNVRQPFGHRHADQEELYVVLDGSGRIKVEDELVEVKQWDVVRVPPRAMHALEAGPEGIEFLAYGAPIAEESNAEMVQGWW
jgi:mannose-6-phosphate isomerase-like protein (cupin superfamily)